MVLVKGFEQIPQILFKPDHPGRWKDEYATPAGEERKVLTPLELITRGRRDRAYTQWLRRFPGVKPPVKHLWQAIRVLRYKYSESTRRDWWERFQESCLRVYVQPLTAYDKGLKAHIQFYIVCYEDTELINRYLISLKGTMLPPRDILEDPFVSSDPRLRKLKLIPTECCMHERHNTTAGKLQEYL